MCAFRWSWAVRERSGDVPGGSRARNNDILHGKAKTKSVEATSGSGWSFQPYAALQKKSFAPFDSNSLLLPSDELGASIILHIMIVSVISPACRQVGFLVSTYVEAK